MKQAKDGDTVKVHYTGKLQDGTVFDDSQGKEPLEFTLGSGQVIPGFEQGIIGMNQGESKTIEIPVDQAYGQRHTELLQQIDHDQLPEGVTPELGMPIELKLKDGEIISFTITGIEEEKIILDANHPLAGENLTFDIELVEIA